jgi:glycine cleavage system regulatory protein
MALTTALQGLAAEGLAVTVTQGSGAPAQGETLNLEIIGQDRPGIVRDLTQALTKLGVNIEELSSAIESAPFTGETMFRATLRLGVPEHVAVERIRQTLEVLADEIMVDVKAGAEAV